MDPLRPFANLIRSLRTSRTSGAPKRSETQASPSAESRTAAVHAPAPAHGVRERLGSRLSGLSPWNETQARQVFVECILLAELGDNLALDAGFAEVVERVSGQLATEPRISIRLDEMLRELATNRG